MSLSRIKALAAAVALMVLGGGGLWVRDYMAMRSAVAQLSERANRPVFGATGNNACGVKIDSGTCNLILNSHKGTGVANGSAASDVAAFGQIPVVATAAPLGALTPAAIGTSAKFAAEDHRHALQWLSNKGIFIFDDFDRFVSSAAGTPGQVQSGLFVLSTTAGGTTQASASAAEVGIALLSTGTSATGKGAISGPFNGTTKNPIILATANALYISMKLSVTTLSDGSNTYIGRCGLSDTFDAAGANGVWFDYIQATDTHWIATTRAGGTSSTTVTTATVNAGTFDHLEIVKDFGSSNYKFYVNGSLLATLNTNIPTLNLDWICGIFKSLGGTARTVAIDWFNGNYFFATPRNSSIGRLELPANDNGNKLIGVPQDAERTRMRSKAA